MTPDEEDFQSILMLYGTIRRLRGEAVDRKDATLLMIPDAEDFRPLVSVYRTIRQLRREVAEWKDRYESAVRGNNA